MGDSSSRPVIDAVDDALLIFETADGDPQRRKMCIEKVRGCRDCFVCVRASFWVGRV
jgi:hypothetical protein